ncbi:MAG: 50S ribosomal protein L13 [Chloroflexi bacterium]|nr:50S ribosomal protein L13 [Chloroflexota bacterium]
MKTYSIKKGDIQPSWHVVDASGKVLGRLASEVAILLKGKHKPTYVTHMDNGDFVIIINASKVKVTGHKAEQKYYYRHSNYPGGLSSISYTKMMEVFPTRVVEHAIKGMLPRNRLGNAMLKKVKIYAGPTHPHKAQIEVKGQEVKS